MEGRQVIKRTLTIIGVTIVLGYSFFMADDFLRGPRIIVETPESGIATTTALVTIKGRVLHINALFMNDSPIPFDLDGNFRESLLLAPGYNIMTIKATDRYNRTTEKNIELTLTQNNQ